MRKPRTKQTEVDLTVPVDPGKILADDETDCFGTEQYSPQDKDCSLCSDIEICGIKFQELIKGKKRAVETEQGPMMDQTDLDGVDLGKVEKLADKYYKEGSPMTFEELQEAIRIQANTKDDDAVLELIRRELPLTRMILKDGLVYVR
jgi:hypothetical protein